MAKYKKELHFVSFTHQVLSHVISDTVNYKLYPCKQDQVSGFFKQHRTVKWKRKQTSWKFNFEALMKILCQHLMRFFHHFASFVFAKKKRKRNETLGEVNTEMTDKSVFFLLFSSRNSIFYLFLLNYLYNQYL